MLCGYLKFMTIEIAGLAKSADVSNISSANFSLGKKITS